MAKKKIELRHIEDPAHGWVEVPETLGKSLGLGTDFPCRNGMLYMEEDCEAMDLDNALKKHGYAPKYPACYVDDFDSWLDGDDWPGIPQQEDETMAKKKNEVDNDEGGVTISGFGVLNIHVELESHTDEDEFGTPDLASYKHRVVLRNPHICKSLDTERFLSAGFILGVELARVANKFRDAIADSDEIAAGFAREMQDWDKDHNKKGKK